MPAKKITLGPISANNCFDWLSSFVKHKALHYFSNIYLASFFSKIIVFVVSVKIGLRLTVIIFSHSLFIIFNVAHKKYTLYLFFCV